MTTHESIVTGHPTLGTLLRNLIESLDGAVERAYASHGLDYRPRYTPVVRVLLDLGPSSIRTISLQARMTHSAVSQTVAEMAKHGWVQMEKGDDARERIVTLTSKADQAIPILLRQWTATELAAQGLESELTMPLSNLVQQALEALKQRPFDERIHLAQSECEVIA